MKLQHVKKNGLGFILIDEVFTKEELTKIYEEVNCLERFTVGPEKTYTAFDESRATYLKKGKGVLLNKHYDNLSKSDINVSFNKLFNDDTIEKIVSFDASYAHLRYYTASGFLINYYDNGDFYDTHNDRASLSIILFLNKGTFSGGELEFSEYNFKILPIENRIVLFHGCILHRVHPIVGDDNSKRISVTKFIGYD